MNMSACARSCQTSYHKVIWKHDCLFNDLSAYSRLAVSARLSGRAWKDRKKHTAVSDTLTLQHMMAETEEKIPAAVLALQYKPTGEVYQEQTCSTSFWEVEKTAGSHFYMTATEMRTMLRHHWGLQGRLTPLYLEAASTVFKTMNKVSDRMGTDRFDGSITPLDTKILYYEIDLKLFIS